MVGLHLSKCTNGLGVQWHVPLQGGWRMGNLLHPGVCLPLSPRTHHHRPLQVPRESHPIPAGHRLALQAALQMGAGCGGIKLGIQNIKNKQHETNPITHTLGSRGYRSPRDAYPTESEEARRGGRRQ